jgi:polar amino acid transport system ATP-binding protein
MPVVQVSEVHKRFGPIEVLNGVSLSIEGGEVYALIGRSGSGKSTLLRCMNGLEPIDAGRIEIAGHEVVPEPRALRRLRQDVGIVFQGYNLFPHLTVERNITLALTAVKRMGRAEARDVAAEVLGQVGLSDKIRAYPEHLSGGQQQRVAIARSLALRPKVMLFDEVTSALDPELTGEVLRVLEKLAQGGMTMVLVTHEMDFARRVANCVVFMHGGRIREAGAPMTLFKEQETSELRQFLAATAH